MYQEQVRILADAGIDLIAAETMINIEETLAAVDAASSVCDLPIMCTMTVEADGSIFSGGNAIEASVSLEAAGADAVGINCSVGPDQLVSVVRSIKENVSIPVIAKPNAGMPTIDDKGQAVYSMNAEDFASYMKVLIEKRRNPSSVDAAEQLRHLSRHCTIASDNSHLFTGHHPIWGRATSTSSIFNTINRERGLQLQKPPFPVSNFPQSDV